MHFFNAKRSNANNLIQNLNFVEQEIAKGSQGFLNSFLSLIVFDIWSKNSKG